MPSRVRETTIFGPASIMLFRQIIHFGGRQWNSFSRITSTCVNLWATGSSSQIPNGSTIGFGFCRQIENFSIFAWDSRTWHRFLKLASPSNLKLATFAGLQFVLEMGVYISLAPFTEPQLTPQQTTIFSILWETE